MKLRHTPGRSGARLRRRGGRKPEQLAAFRSLEGRPMLIGAAQHPGAGCGGD